MGARKIFWGGIVAPPLSAVGPIWLGRRLEKKPVQKACAAMSFSLLFKNFQNVSQNGGSDALN
jgi:hypothetical protein